MKANFNIQALRWARMVNVPEVAATLAVDLMPLPHSLPASVQLGGSK
jgi:hypothetical protein